MQLLVEHVLAWQLLRCNWLGQICYSLAKWEASLGDLWMNFYEFLRMFRYVTRKILIWSTAVILSTQDSTCQCRQHLYFMKNSAFFFLAASHVPHIYFNCVWCSAFLSRVWLLSVKQFFIQPALCFPLVPNFSRYAKPLLSPHIIILVDVDDWCNLWKSSSLFSCWFVVWTLVRNCQLSTSIFSVDQRDADEAH